VEEQEVQESPGDVLATAAAVKVFSFVKKCLLKQALPMQLRINKKITFS
jgi:hypothetical protein